MVVWTVVFLSGAAVLVLELAAPRLLAPACGSSVSVWASVLSVTMLALAAGYRFGGQAVDRRPAPRTLFLAAGAGGAAAALPPLLKDWVLPLAAAWGPAWGSFAGAALLFGAPLALLGAVPPVAARLLTPRPDLAGTVAGRVSAASTAGGLAGALAAGALLLPNLGVRSILWGTAAAQTALALLALLFPPPAPAAAPAKRRP